MVEEGGRDVVAVGCLVVVVADALDVFERAEAAGEESACVPWR